MEVRLHAISIHLVPCTSYSLIIGSHPSGHVEGITPSCWTTNYCLLYGHAGQLIIVYYIWFLCLTLKIWDNIHHVENWRYLWFPLSFKLHHGALWSPFLLRIWVLFIFLLNKQRTISRWMRKSMQCHFVFKWENEHVRYFPPFHLIY